MVRNRTDDFLDDCRRSNQMQSLIAVSLCGRFADKEIAEELAKQGITVDKKKIVLPEAIKEFGKYDIKVKLHKDVQAIVKLNVAEE